jgi:hypothetical protein
VKARGTGEGTRPHSPQSNRPRLDGQHKRFNHLSRQIHDLNRQIRGILGELDSPNLAISGDMVGEVPLIDLRLPEGVFSRDERRHLAESLIGAVVGVKGESFRSEIKLLIAEVPGGNRHEREALRGPEEGDEPP